MDLYQLVFKSTFQFTGILDLDGRLLDANTAALNFINKDLDAVVGRLFWETEWWTHDANLQQVLKESFERLKIDKETQRFEVTHPRHDQQISAFDFSISPILDDQANILYIIAEGRDISKVKEAERDREYSEIRYRDLFMNSEDAYLIIEDNRFIEFNPATVKMLGFKDETDLHGVHPSQLSPEYQPDGRLSYEKAEEMIDIAYSIGTNRFEWVHKKADGTEFPVEVLLTPIRQGNRTLLFTVWRDITIQKNNEDQVLYMNQELETRIQERTKALTDSLAELEKTQNSLVESKKLAALGQLIIGISHEMNTPIGTAITGVTYLNLLVKDIQQCLADATCTTDVAQETFQDVDALSHSIIKSLEHAAALIDKFKSLSVAPFEDRLGEADLYTIAQQAIKPFLKDLDRQNHQIDVRIPSPFVIETHAVTMGNILTQLISNALFHGFEDQLNGLIQILVEEEAHALIIKVIDNGKGLKQDELDKIFDPFFTTHRGTGKTGLGMNIVYNQVHQILHGDIVVENNAGSRGCTIVLRLPKEHAE